MFHKSGVFMLNIMKPCNKSRATNVFSRSTVLGEWVLICLLGSFFLPNMTLAEESVEIIFQAKHGGRVHDVAINLQGNVVATAGGDHTVRLWELGSGRLVLVLEGHTMNVMSVTFSKDGSLLASGSADTSIRIWETKSGQLLKILDVSGNAGVHAVTFSGDGRFLVSGHDDKKVRVWDWKTIRQPILLEGAEATVQALSVSPDGKHIASGSQFGEVLIWDWEKQELLHTLEGHKFLWDVRFSPDGSRLASGGDGIRIWDWASEREIHLLKGHSLEVNSLAFSSDGKFLFSGGGDNTVRRWDLDLGKLLQTFKLKEHNDRLIAVAFSADESFFVSGSKDGTARLWNFTDGQPIREFRGQERIFTMETRLSPNGKYLVSGGGDGVIRMWNMTNGNLVQYFKGHDWPISSLTLSPTGRYIASSGKGHLRVWELESGQLLHTFKVEGQVWTTAFSPDGQYLVSGGEDKLLRIWDLERRSQTGQLDGHAAPVYRMAFSPDGRFLASGGEDGTIRMWDWPHKQLLGTQNAHSKLVSAVLFHSEGKYLASASPDNYVRGWEVKKNGREVTNWIQGNWDSPHPGYNGIYSLAFSPDGKYFATGHADKRIRVWGQESGQLVNTLIAQGQRTSSLAFGPGGKYLVSGSWDGRIRFWNHVSGQELFRIILLSGSDWMAYTPDGFFDGTVRAWQTIPFKLKGQTSTIFEPEQFFNLFYEPGLMAQILKTRQPIRDYLRARGDPREDLDISKYRDSHLPHVRLTLPQPGPQSSQRELLINLEAQDTGTGVRDCRMFRNQTLIHSFRGILPVDPSSQMYKSPSPLLVKLTAGPNKITAYCFNHDNIKSKDATVTVTGDESLARQGVAYIVTVGVNEYANPAFNLKYAAPDAQLVKGSVAKSLQNLSQYSRVVSVTLQDKQATKQNIQTVLTRLASSKSPLSPDLPTEFGNLQEAEPEDLVLIYFAGHGTARGDRYYLIPHDIGDGGNQGALNESHVQTILERSLSDKELEASFEKIDAGDVVLIIDACESGQALESEEPRRGPLNSRGLAQLAYEKGMYILAAAQAYESAVELDNLGHGLLTHVLVKDGLSQMQADMGPRDGQLTAREWFDFAIQEVPREYEVAKQRYLKAGGRPIVFDQKKERVGGQVPRGYYRREITNQPLILAKSQ